MAKSNKINHIVLEKNVQKFNSDITSKGGYLYTSKSKMSSIIATERQTIEIVNFLRKYVKRDSHILDVGCGDGTYTFELFKKYGPIKITAFDVAEKAIEKAWENNKYKKQIIFKTANIYFASKELKKEKFDIAVVRGVLHHLYNPEKAVNEIAKLVSKVIVLEPSGYNPLLKVIEKVSPYHRVHEEKSYFPPKLNSWFIKEGYSVVEQKFFGIVPYFFPDKLSILLKKTEKFFEGVPLLNKIYSGTNIIYYEKNNLIPDIS